MNIFRFDPVFYVRLKELIMIIFLWVFLAYFITLIFYFSQGDNINLVLSESKALSILMRNMDGVALAAFIIGALTGTFQVFVIPKRYKNAHIVRLVLAQFLVFFFSVSLASLIALYIYEAKYNNGDLFTFMQKVEGYMLSKTYITLFAIGYLINAIVGLFRFIRNKMGNKILIPILMGRYFNPKEEDRIFTFIDLRSSVEIAEKLTPIEYSKYLQDCFHDLEESIIRFNGQIYQYVGDECVIT